ncbi:NADH-quinone oxidoreductase subunit L [Rhodobacteraceae bacterium RKSG542]|uniref:NADH-quinone oxidoreductase subunit L n=1 Tax=Pseudovibrio flavus TaxID=2529854 RepID=UPI0012BCBBFE|nr:NADH-quinone oxidoreductase subunit L [Pseudovibrio flavus]MTI16681.1 NADH-quinone oxidoreductase subunit L [Pseudovibrio flavus]
MYSAIVFLPLLGFLIVGLFGRALGNKASEYITSGFLVIAALLSWVAFFSVGIGSGPAVQYNILSWIQSGNLDINWAIRVDTLTVVMLVVVNSVSALVHVYSIGYMHHDPDRPRFFAYLSLFTFAMLALVTSDNLLQMFFGWEGVGLASYLLIGFWFKKPSANAAAIKAFVVNRVGDFGFILGIAGVFVIFGSTDFNSIFSTAGAIAQGQTPVLEFLGYSLDPDTALTVVCLLLFMGAMGKSAQFMLHTWLPDAMEGPTPVSALIHAATMVTAGVFMVARLSPIFELSPTALTFVTLIGGTTAIFAATVGCVQNDIKRVIAYSTCSQLGYMFVALGVGAYSVGIFHLFTHAFFKALLFLGAGSVIHAVSDEQDMRKMGGLRKHIPYTYWTMVIGTLALTGFGIPFIYIYGIPLGTAGFISKDAIIEAAYVGQNAFAGYAFWMTVFAAFLTSFYSWRLVFMTFFGKPKASADVMSHVHESPWVMVVPLLILAMGAVFAGPVFKTFFAGDAYDAFWKGALFTSDANHILHEMHNVPKWVIASPFVMMVLGFIVAWVFYISKPDMPKALAARHDVLYRFLLNKWYFDELYNFLFVRPAFKIGRFLWKSGDGSVIDGFGPDGVAARVQQVTARVVKLQSGYIYHYAFAMLIGVAFFITWSMFAGGGAL